MSLVAEIVGPAGAGKSTLAQALGRRDGGVRAGLGVWGLPAPVLVWSALVCVPRLWRMWRGGGAVGREAAGLVVRLEALGRVLGRESAKRRRVLLLDEGTVFALAKLRGFARGDGEARTRELVGRWAGRLDAVVWLDAPDEVLARRIRERAKPHRMKARTDAELASFLARYRESYERVVESLRAGSSGLKVIRVNTNGQTPDELAEEVLRRLAGGEG
jgi:shikimate kinase